MVFYQDIYLETIILVKDDDYTTGVYLLSFLKVHLNYCKKKLS